LGKKDAAGVEDFGLEFVEVDTVSSVQERNDELEVFV
jgi:hypothetical protein